MKKLLLICICLLSQFPSFSQCNPVSDSDLVSRGALALFIFEKLYEDNLNLNDYEAATFPNPFIDLQDNNDLFIKLKILSYLQYDNGLTVYNYGNKPSACFKPLSTITKFEALLYVMEAWNITPDFSQNNTPYNDVNVLDIDVVSGYINGAYNEGIISGSGNFNPFSNLTIGEASQIVCNVYNNSSLHPVNKDLTDTDNYFIPGIYSPENLSQFRGLNQGVFNHYAKNSFVIPDRKMSLNFSHFYSSTMVELPQGFYPILPLGRGWSHTYNAYITRENNVGPDKIDYYYIAWQDGTIHIYNENDNEYVSNSVYDDLDELSGNRIRITHKDQSRHYFEQLDNDRDIWYLIEIQDANGNEITIDYESAEEDDTRRIEFVEAPSGKKLRFEYANNTDYIDKIIDPINREIRFDLDEDDDNRLEKFIDAMGNNTRYRYVENNANAPFQNQKQRFLLDEIKLPRGNKITANYDEDNVKLSSYQIDNDDPIMVDVDFDYENNNITTEVKTPIAGSSNPFTENYTFNNNGLVTDYDSDTNNVQVTYPNSGVNVMLPTETTSNGVTIDYDYDNRGNVTKIDKENGDIIEEFVYDSDNNLSKYTDGEGNITKFSYDGNENLTKIEDAYNNSTFFTYDTYGQLLSQTNQAGIAINYTYENDGVISTMTAPANISSSFSYDGVNRLKQRNDNGLISSYNYDANDNLTKMTNSGGFVTNYSYDPNDNLSSIKNAKNITTSFTYDNEDRVIKEQFGNLTTQYDYSDEGYLDDITKPSGAKINYDYDNDGRLEKTGTITDIDYNSRNLVKDITNATGKMGFDYDNLNLLEKVTTVHGYKVEYDYSDTNQVEELKYPSFNAINLETNYQYDKKNRIWKIVLDRNVGGSNNIIAKYEYHDDDRIKWIDLANNTRIEYSYDNAGRLNNIKHINKTTSVSFYVSNLTLDNRGNIIKSIELLPEIDTNGGNFGLNPSGGNFDEYSYDDNNHAETIRGVSHSINDDGNTIGIGNDTSLNFDIDDRLTTYSDVDNNLSFKYNAYNQRVEKTKNGTTTKYVRDVRLDNILVELDQNNSPLHYYIYSPSGMLLARMKPNGDLHYYHGDIRGSVVMMTDENADITHQYRYDDFGTITNYNEPTNDTNFFRYVGVYGVEHETDDLYYMRARYYRPSIGRFLSEDPIWHDNLYPYANNNPISRVDPSGKIAPLVVLGVAWAITEVSLTAIDLYYLSAVENDPYSTQAEIDEAHFGAFLGLVAPFGGYAPIKNSKPVRESLLNVAQNKKLRNIINEIYRPNVKNPIGDGGAIDAFRHTRDTGVPVGRTDHKEKLERLLPGLYSIVRNPSGVNQQDLNIANQLIDNIIKAFNGN